MAAAFPMWTSEPGVGRDKSTELTRQMDEIGMAGGDYWNTNYPQPTFLTSRWLAVHLDASCYTVLDFTDPAAHCVEVGASRPLRVFAADGPQELVGALSTRFGRQPPLARLGDWRGDRRPEGRRATASSGWRNSSRQARPSPACGARTGPACAKPALAAACSGTGGVSDQRYPDLPERIAALKARGIRFLAYANPYLAVDGILYAEAGRAAISA